MRRQALAAFLSAVCLLASPGAAPYQAWALSRQTSAGIPVLRPSLKVAPVPIARPSPSARTAAAQVRDLTVRASAIEKPQSPEALRGSAAWEDSAVPAGAVAEKEGAALAPLDSATAPSRAARPSPPLSPRPTARAKKYARYAAYAALALGAVALTLKAPLGAVFLVGGVSVRCMSQRRAAEEEAMKRAIVEQKRREEALKRLRGRYWELARRMEERLVRDRKRVLVDRELVMEGATEALVRSYRESLEDWKKSLPDAATAQRQWQDRFEVDLKDNLSRQGLWGDAAAVGEVLGAELPAFVQATLDWQNEYQATASLHAGAQAALAEAARAETAQAAAPAAAAQEDGFFHFEQKAARSEAAEKKEPAAAKGSASDGAARTLGLVALFAFLGLFARAVHFHPALSVGGLAGLGAVVCAGLVVSSVHDNPAAKQTLDEFLKEADTKDVDFAKRILKDLSAQRLRPFAGRSAATTSLLAVLAQKESTKKGVLLVGRQGVGKMTIVQNLASEVAAGTYPLNRKFLELDLSRLSGFGSQVGGPGEKSPFDRFFDDVLPSLNQKAVLVIKGLDQLLGPANAGNNFLERLRQPIEDGSVRFVFLLTPSAEKLLPEDHYLRKYAKTIVMAEPDEAEAEQMMLAHKAGWEAAYSANILDAAIEQAVVSSKEFLRRLNPLELVDILEEVLRRKEPGSQGNAARAEFNDAFSRLSQALGRWRRTAANKDHNEAIALAARIGELREKGVEESIVRPDDVKETMAEVYDNPLIAKSEDFKQSVLDAIPRVRARIVGQDAAVEMVNGTLRRTAAGLEGHNRPLGSFAFLGPTGVGKTELARALAEGLFGTEKALVRFDMSEFMEKASVNRFIGSPPGYVNHEEGGQLTEAVKRRPYSVLLFDEIEKAHPDVFNILLQVLDDGRLTDGKNDTVDFKRTIIIMTSNLGSAEIQALPGRENRERREEVAKRALAGHFKPEFINRIDSGIVVFDPLEKEQLMDIGKLLVKKELGDPMATRGHHLAEVAKKVVQYVIDHGGYEPEMGARPMRRMLKKHVGDPLSDHLLDYSQSRRVSVDLSPEGEMLVSSEDLALREVERHLPPPGRLGRWTRRILDQVRQPDFSIAALRAAFSGVMGGSLAPAVWGAFSLQTPPPAGTVKQELLSYDRDLNAFDRALGAPEASGGGVFGWLDSLRAAGYGDEEVGPVQAWLSKNIRCAKDARRARESLETPVSVRWKEGEEDWILEVSGPALDEAEKEEAWEAFENHYAAGTKDAAESLALKESLVREGRRGRALLSELQRELADAGARFGSYWSPKSSTYWLSLPKKAKTELELERERQADLSRRLTEAEKRMRSLLEKHRPQPPVAPAPERSFKRVCSLAQMESFWNSLLEERRGADKSLDVGHLALVLGQLDWSQVRGTFNDFLVDKVFPLARGNAYTADRLIPILLPWLRDYAPAPVRAQAAGWFPRYAEDWAKAGASYNHKNLVVALAGLEGASAATMQNKLALLTKDGETASQVLDAVAARADARALSARVEKEVEGLKVEQQFSILAGLKAPQFATLKASVVLKALEPLKDFIDIPQWDLFLLLLQNPALLELPPILDRAVELFRGAPFTIHQKLEEDASYAPALVPLARAMRVGLPGDKDAGATASLESMAQRLGKATAYELLDLSQRIRHGIESNPEGATERLETALREAVEGFAPDKATKVEQDGRYLPQRGVREAFELYRFLLQSKPSLVPEDIAERIGARLATADLSSQTGSVALNLWLEGQMVELALAVEEKRPDRIPARRLLTYRQAVLRNERYLQVASGGFWTWGRRIISRILRSTPGPDPARDREVEIQRLEKRYLRRAKTLPFPEFAESLATFDLPSGRWRPLGDLQNLFDAVLAERPDFKPIVEGTNLGRLEGPVAEGDLASWSAEIGGTSHSPDQDLDYALKIEAALAKDPTLAGPVLERNLREAFAHYVKVVRDPLGEKVIDLYLGLVAAHPELAAPELKQIVLSQLAAGSTGARLRRLYGVLLARPGYLSVEDCLSFYKAVCDFHGKAKRSSWTENPQQAFMKEFEDALVRKARTVSPRVLLRAIGDVDQESERWVPRSGYEDLFERMKGEWPEFAAEASKYRPQL